MVGKALRGMLKDPKSTILSLAAPSPTTAVPYMSVKCIDVRKNHHKTKWLMPWGPNHCEKLKDFDEAVSRQIEANDIVFAVHIPLPSKEMSPWFQFMLFIMQLDIAFKMDNDLSKLHPVHRFPSISFTLPLCSVLIAVCPNAGR